MMYRIPTGYYGRLLDRDYHFHSKYWWLRSSYTNDRYAWRVHPSGVVYYDGGVYRSYGRKNRRTRTTISIYGILDQMENIDLPRFIMMIPTGV